jgi:hypothetical protein
MNDAREDKSAELDLTGEQASEGDAALEPSTVPYNSEQDRERVRGLVALLLIGLLAFAVVGSFIGLATKMIEMKDLKELLTIVLGPLIALVGAATGFYFGERK